MKRVNTSFVISLIIHILGALILLQVHREAATRKGVRSIPVQLNVPAPEPRLEEKKPQFKPDDLSPDLRSVKRTSSPRLVKIQRKMDDRTAYRDIIVTDDSETPVDLEMSEDGVQMGDLLPTRSGARGAGRGVRGGKSQLVEFVDKSKGRRRIVYCLDVSASMGAASKLNLSRNYLKDSILALNGKRDMFNIIAFSRDMSVFYSGGLVQATKENVALAMDFLDQYTPQNILSNTKTDLLSVVLRALDMEASIIALVTDGLPTTGVTQPGKILQSIREKNANGRVRIFAIGMEMDQEQPEAWLLRAIAEQNSGETQFF